MAGEPEQPFCAFRCNGLQRARQTERSFDPGMSSLLMLRVAKDTNTSISVGKFFLLSMGRILWGHPVLPNAPMVQNDKYFCLKSSSLDIVQCGHESSPERFGKTSRSFNALLLTYFTHGNLLMPFIVLFVNLMKSTFFNF